MSDLRKPKFPQTFRAVARNLKAAPFVLYLIPAITLLAFWLGGEGALLITALGVPLVFGAATLWVERAEEGVGAENPADLLSDEMFNKLASVEIEAARVEGRKTAVFRIRIDDFDELVQRHGQAAAENVKQQGAARIRSCLRQNDLVGAFGDDGYSVCMSPQPALDLEVCLQQSARISRALEEPFSVDGIKVYATVCVGFCQLGRETKSLPSPKMTDTSEMLRDQSSDLVIRCATVALEAAVAMAPAAIRAYAPDLTRQHGSLNASQQSVVDALENGEILPWFQPQISTDTGMITGFECLARWIDPQSRAIAPAEFLPQLEAANKMSRLLEVILYHGMTALKAWDQAGLNIQQIGVNFSQSELSDPGLVEKVAWELDRFELAPERLAVEVLETVVGQGPDDVVTRNIRSLAELGCRIDLDDFGTGYASLASIRRFGVGRIKIDRSFVMKADRDLEQQRMIKAILTMAERLDIDTLAEGVETVGEHALLAQLGCTHVQGFGIGRPMPFDQTMNWIRAHNAKLDTPPLIGKNVG